MRLNSFGRGSALVAVLAAAGSLLLGFTPASATTPIYQANDVAVRVTGDDAIALNRCVNDAQDGYINTQINSCEQVATAGNIVQLENSAIWVFRNCGCGVPLFSSNHVTVEVSGGLAQAVNECINDSQDGVINTQINRCRQYATAGNIVFLSGVSVSVYQ
jgi:hypothetical protein